MSRSLRFRRVDGRYLVNGRPLEEMTAEERETFATMLEAALGPMAEDRKAMARGLRFIAEADAGLERMTLGEVVDFNRRRAPAGQPGPRRGSGMTADELEALVRRFVKDHRRRPSVADLVGTGHGRTTLYDAAAPGGLVAFIERVVAAEPN